MAYKDSIVSIAATVVQDSLMQMFKTRRHNQSTVPGMIVQGLLAQLFNSQENFSILCPATIL